MRRIQSFEFNEQAWLPQNIRNTIVETLGHGLGASGVYEPVIPVFVDFCRRAGCKKILELCSGSGEPVSFLISAMQRLGARVPKFVISDLFPDTMAMEEICARHHGLVEMISYPIDATNAPKDIDCQAIMLNNAFHHFDCKTAASILADCVAKNRAIFIVEGQNGRLRHFLALYFSLITTALTLPLKAKKNRLKKLFYTYGTFGILLPIGTWDAVISVLRVYRQDDLMSMAGRFSGGYTWEFVEVPYAIFGRAVVFMGFPGEKKLAGGGGTIT